MSNSDHLRKQAQQDAQQGKGPRSDNSFSSDADRKAYQAEYNRNKK